MQAAQAFVCDIAEKISMPEVYHKLRQLMNKPQAKVDEFEKLIRADSMLTLRIMQIANSEFFGFNRNVDNLYDAICLIGVVQLHDVLLSSLCMRTFYNIPEQILNYNEFWLHGIQRGIASKSIARLCRLPAGNRFFAVGLLLEIGHAAMFAKAPELAIQTLMESQQHQLPIVKVERKNFGFDYCQLGSALMHQWHVPAVYAAIIEHHLTPELIEPNLRIETAVVNLACRICESSGQFEPGDSELLGCFRQFANFPENFADLIVSEVAKNIESIFTMLSPPQTHLILANSTDTEL